MKYLTHYIEVYISGIKSNFRKMYLSHPKDEKSLNNTTKTKKKPGDVNTSKVFEGKNKENLKNEKNSCKMTSTSTKSLMSMR